MPVASRVLPALGSCPPRHRKAGVVLRPRLAQPLNPAVYRSTMASTIVIRKRGVYPDRSFKLAAVEAWNKFFEIASPVSDLAHWLIKPDSATVRLSARVSSVDED